VGRCLQRLVFGLLRQARDKKGGASVPRRVVTFNP
jgi:hypothetical protein